VVKTAALMAVALLLAPVAAKAEWRKYDTVHFVIYSESSEKEVTRLAERLETVDGLMRMASGLKSDVEPVKVRIYQVASNEEVEKAINDPNSGVEGFYTTNIFGPFAVTPRHTNAEGDFTPELVLHHEYAHHFMLQYFPAVYPGWYTEGYAELIGSSRFLPDGRIGYGMPAKHRGNDISAYWTSMEDILLKSPDKIHNFDLYGQGWAMTHFLTFSPTRAPQLRKYLALLTAGASPQEAAKAFGDLAELNREAHKYLAAGSFPYRPVAVPIRKPVIQKSEIVSPGEAALIPEIIAFRDDDPSAIRKDADRTREMKARAENIAHIRQKAARFANDPFALYMLAQAEYSVGDFRAAEAAADRLLAIQPNHARALVVKSLCVAEAAGRAADPQRAQLAAQARKLALKANAADHDDPLPLLAYYQSYHLAHLKAPKEAIDYLSQVVATMPQDDRIRMLLVEGLAAEHRYGQAIAMLMPIANSTHPSPQRDAARALLARLEAEAANGGKKVAPGA
jgi:tetratricopeptide (TPR) repeat protein